MNISFDFNQVTFGLPVETFHVEAYIALEERLPVVTEFVLRLLRICGQVPLPAFRDYFGFSDGEALAVIESLSRQGLLDVFDDEIQLSRYAIERFEEAGGELPRFSKVELKKDTVTFDLISFTPLRSSSAEIPSDNILKLDTADDVLGQSVEHARTAYRQRYPEIASMREDFREKSFGVYSVEDVESKRRNYVPVPVAFALNQEGQVERRIDEAFERVAPPELVHFVNEQVTLSIPRTLSVVLPGLEEFIDTFDLKLMQQYLTGKKFDLHTYLKEVHIMRSTKYPRGMDAVFGNLYLQENRERIIARIKDRREGRRRHGKLLTSMAWLAPDYPLWGRGGAFAGAVSAFSSELQSEKSSDSLYLFACAEQDQENSATQQFRVPQLRELHYFRPLLAGGFLQSGRLELLLYPTAFMIALYHLPIAGSNGLWVPVGFMSTLPKHLDTAQKLLRKTIGGQRYGKRAQFNLREKREQPRSFEEACPFLQYCGLNTPRNLDDNIEGEDST
ncbi:hypothetical protein [Methyloterricola oryzae]|uniref:hypothetical protein n=1 Tax=Methyloterricola oryzae TaxID=1495050 RepID=UPI0005EBE06F|nr:hypothetical protein [Methyloterricola oryzae]